MSANRTAITFFHDSNTIKVDHGLNVVVEQNQLFSKNAPVAVYAHQTVFTAGEQYVLLMSLQRYASSPTRIDPACGIHRGGLEIYRPRAIVDQRINFGRVHAKSLRDVIARVPSVYVDERIWSRVPSNTDLIYTTLRFVFYLG